MVIKYKTWWWWFAINLQRLNDESILRSQLDLKTPHQSVSGRSYLASTPDSSNIAVFEVRRHIQYPSVLTFLKLFQLLKSCVALFTSQGDWVWLKKCPIGVVSSINSNTEMVFVRVRQHFCISTADRCHKTQQIYQLYPPDSSQSRCLHCPLISWETWDTRTSTFSWDCSSTSESSALWLNTASGEVWRTCSIMRMCVLTGCSSLPC